MTTLLYSGNLGLGQDLGTVLHAAARLPDDIDLRILVAGQGKNLSSIKELAVALQLRNVEFRDPVALHRLPELLAAGDIHLVCQKPGTEGLLVPSKTYGILAIGRSMIFLGPEHCEVARIVRESACGFVVAPGDVESAAQVLKQLAVDADLRRKMGERAMRYYREHFGRGRSVTQIIDVLERVAEMDGETVKQHITGRPYLVGGGREKEDAAMIWKRKNRWQQANSRGP